MDDSSKLKDAIEIQGHQIPIGRIRDLLVCAFEGGSNYWYCIHDQTLPAGTVADDFADGGKMQPPGDYYHPLELIPTVAGGSLMIVDREADAPRAQHTLDLTHLESGLLMLAQKYPAQFKAILDEEEDAETGDVFLQCCLFAEVIYG